MTFSRCRRPGLTKALKENLGRRNPLLAPVISLGTSARDNRVDLRHRTVADQGDQRARLTNGRNRHDLQADRRRAHTLAGGQRGRTWSLSSVPAPCSTRESRSNDPSTSRPPSRTNQPKRRSPEKTPTMGLDNISVIMRHRGKMLRGKGIAKSFPQLTTRTDGHLRVHAQQADAAQDERHHRGV